MNILENQDLEQTITAADIAEGIRDQVKAAWNRIVHYHQRGMNSLWDENGMPEGITTQDVIAALGTDAVEVFDLSAALAGLIASIDATKVVNVPEGTTVTRNADGTVTITVAPTEPTE